MTIRTCRTVAELIIQEHELNRNSFPGIVLFIQYFPLAILLALENLFSRIIVYVANCISNGSISELGKMFVVALEKNLLTCVPELNLQAWSNGRYQSAVHQVLLTEKKVWRLSMIYALNPNRNIYISCPPELVDAKHPRRYRPFTWPDFIANLRANRHRIRDKLALDFVKIPIDEC